MICTEQALIQSALPLLKIFVKAVGYLYILCAESWAERSTCSSTISYSRKTFVKVIICLSFFHAHVDIQNPPLLHKLIVNFSFMCKSVWCIQSTFYLKPTYLTLLLVKKILCDYSGTKF